MWRVEVGPEFSARLTRLGARDTAVVGENVQAIRSDPRQGGHPSFLSPAKRLAWQHVCPHSFVVLFRWPEADPSCPAGTIVLDDIVPRF